MTDRPTEWWTDIFSSCMFCREIMTDRPTKSFFYNEVIYMFCQSTFRWSNITYSRSLATIASLWICLVGNLCTYRIWMQITIILYTHFRRFSKFFAQLWIFQTIRNGGQKIKHPLLIRGNKSESPEYENHSAGVTVQSVSLVVYRTL